MATAAIGFADGGTSKQIVRRCGCVLTLVSEAERFSVYQLTVVTRLAINSIGSS